MTMYWLANGGHYQTIADNFGLGKSTVHAILHETAQALDKSLFSRLVKWPGEMCDRLATSRH